MDILIYAVIILALVLAAKLLFSSVRFVFKMLINSLVGFVLLICLASLGVRVRIDLITCLITGILGIPGAVIIFIISRFM